MWSIAKKEQTNQPPSIVGIFNVRTSVKENHLSREEMEQMGITESVVIDMIEKVVAHVLLWMAEKRLFFFDYFT